MLIWAASQIVEARNVGLPSLRLMAATPYEILRYIGRGTAPKDYRMLRAPLDRLQSTTVLTFIRQAGRRQHRFSWINEWQEQMHASGRPDGIELILTDWFYTGARNDALVLSLDRAYLRLTGGIERQFDRLERDQRIMNTFVQTHRVLIEQRWIAPGVAGQPHTTPSPALGDLGVLQSILAMTLRLSCGASALPRSRP